MLRYVTERLLLLAVEFVTFTLDAFDQDNVQRYCTRFHGQCTRYQVWYG